MLMAIHLNHTIVAAHDKEMSATFLTNILGLSSPILLGPFAVVHIDDETSLDYVNVEDYRGSDSDIASQHYAFLVTEKEFDEIFARIRERRLTYWADPYRREPNQINRWDDGRGIYFDDPNGHLLEVITRPYGSGGTTASRPHPLFAPILEPAEEEDRRAGPHGEQDGADTPGEK
jgi:catechol 2,3-dioxygenase-like lactoylglutathione lyase family enzyme